MAAILSLLTATLSGCFGDEDLSGINYAYLYDCLWLPAEGHTLSDEIPILSGKGNNPIYFDKQGRMVMFRNDEGVYRFDNYIDYQLDRGMNTLVITPSGEEYAFRVDILASSHITFHSLDKPDDYIIYVRESFPPSESIDSSSYPFGW